MTPRSIRTLEQLRSDVANTATGLDSGTLRLWVTALDEVLREVGGDAHRDVGWDAWKRLATVSTVEGVSALTEADDITGFGRGNPAKATEDAGSEVGPEPLSEEERAEMAGLQRQHYLNGLGDRPHSMAAAKLARMLDLERRAKETP